MITPAAACPLNAVETLFGITKARYRKWLLAQWGNVEPDQAVRKLREIYSGVGRQEARRVSKIAFKVYEKVLHG